MKVTSAQIYNAAITLLAGQKEINEKAIKRAIETAQITADLVPEIDNMPNDEELEAACIKFVTVDKPYGAALLGNMFASEFGIPLQKAYTLLQKATTLGFIIPNREGKNKTTYTLSPELRVGSVKPKVTFIHSATDED